MPDAAELAKITDSAKLASVAGSIRNNPNWTEKDFDAFREKAKACTPVVFCKGHEKQKEPFMMTVTVPGVPDCTHIWVQDINRKIVAEKTLKPGEPATLEFEVPSHVKGLMAVQQGKAEGAWKTQPYMKFADHTGKFEWRAMLSYEKGACHTAPNVPCQWYPQLDRHPELRRPEAGRKQLKILYLHGHSNNKEIGLRQVEAVRGMWPFGHPIIDILEGNVDLTMKAHFASVIDYSPQLVELGLGGGPGYQLKGYGHIEAPAADPKNDPTAQTNCEGVTWAKMSKASMEFALDALEAHVVKEGGYDIILGFSQGGEVVQNLINRIQALNARVETKTAIIALFGTRIYFKKYGAITAKFAPAPEEGKPCELKAFVVMGQKDDEDIKDASRDTDNLWDLKEFRTAFEAAGIQVHTDTHPGGHEMPDIKMQGTRQLFTKLYEMYWEGRPATTYVDPNAPGPHLFLD